MSEPSVDNWKNIPDRGSLWLINLITHIILLMGRRVGRLFLYPIVTYFILFSSTTRYSRLYLKRCMGRQARPVDLFRHYYSFANMLLDRVYLLSGRTSAFDVTIHGIEQINRLIKRGDGIILLGSHLGNFDLLRVLSAHYSDIKIKALMNIDNTQKVNQVFEKLNPGLKNDVIEVGRINSMLEVQEFLQQGNLVGMLSDRVEDTARSSRCNFLGKDTFFPTGPFIIAGVLKVPVIMCFALHRKKNCYDIYFQLFDEHIILPGKERQEKLMDYAQRYASCLEEYCKKSPYNWYNFYDFWNDDNSYKNADIQQHGKK
jgi:predicted LPLAT superfamily acyltransferase